MYRQREKERESSIVEEFYEINIAIHRHTYIKYLYPLISLLTIVLLSFFYYTKYRQAHSRSLSSVGDDLRRNLGEEVGL